MAVDRSFAARNQVPEGVKDRLPREAARLSGLGERLLGAFAAWGYRPVTTPAFEFVETVSAGLTAAIREDLYQFFDRRGRTLALRPDMTTPIARLVATKLAAEPLPLRLSYWADVFRHQGRKSGALHEVWQAGVELVGAAGATADAEVVALACEALAATGLEGYKVGLGHVDFVEGLFAHAGLSAATVEELKEALVLRDFVAYEKGVATAAVEPATADLLLSLMSFHGSWQDALSRYSGVNNPRVRRALAQLGETLQYLAAATHEVDGFNRILLIVHGLEAEETVVLPAHAGVNSYTLLFDSAFDWIEQSEHAPGSTVTMSPTSMKLFRAH